MKRIDWIKQAFVLILSLLCVTVYGAENAAPNAAPAPTSQTSQAKPNQQSVIPAPPTVDAKGYILMDANTGIVLAGKEIDTPMPPASLTKLMTLYQIASALQQNRLHLDDRISISEKAWRTGGSKMFVKVNDQVPVNDLIQGIAVVSGNDACVAMAEHLAGSEESFAGLMNQSATLLGMKNTHYTDATGLPNPNHYSTPRDLAVLTKAIVNEFPQYYGWYSQKEFLYNGIKQPNRDILLWRDPSIEGMKTGHTDEAGYCLVSTASRNGMRLISVVMGSTSTRTRADASLALLNYGFRFYESKKMYSANTPIKLARVYYGENSTLPVGVFRDFYVTAPTGQLASSQVTVNLDSPLKAPIKKGQAVGNIVLKMTNKDDVIQPLYALQDDPKGGIFGRMGDHVAILFSKMFN